MNCQELNILIDANFDAYIEQIFLVLDEILCHRDDRINVVDECVLVNRILPVWIDFALLQNIRTENHGQIERVHFVATFLFIFGEKKQKFVA